MKQTLLLFAFIAITVACQKKAADQTALTDSSATVIATDSIAEPTGPDMATATADDFEIVPGQKVGKVRPDSDENDLLDVYGPANVLQRDTIYTAEGNYEIGTTLYKGTPDEAAVLWTDSAKQARPNAVKLMLLDPASAKADRKSRWQTANGVRLGLTINEIEKINGKPFKLYGFEWDFGGSVTDWRNGRLQTPGSETYLTMTFGYTDLSPAQETAISKVSGDAEFLSSDPAMKLLNPIVQQIFVRFK